MKHKHQRRRSEPSAPARLRELLANRAYRRLWAAQTVSRSGDVFNTVALAVLVFLRTGSGLGVAGVVVAEIIPVLVLAAIAGAVVDRFGPVRVMVAADLWRMLLAALLPLADSLTTIYPLAFGLSAGAVFFNPAASSLLPAVVPHSQLVRANSGVWTAAVLAQIVLAPLAGGMVALVGVTPAFLLNAASYLVSALLLRGLRVSRPATADPTRATWLAQARAGVQAITAVPLLRTLALVQVLAALSAGATSALLIVLATRHLQLDPDGFGLLLAAIGVGAATGPLLLARVGDPRRPQLVFGPFVLRGIVDLVLAGFRSFPVALAALGLYGVGTSTGMVTYNALLQSVTPADRRGRVFAGFDALWQLGRLVSLLLGGVAADVLGIRSVYVLGGLLLLLAGAVGFRRLRLEKPAEQ